MAKKTKFKISGMHCGSCAIVIDGDLEDTKGVKRAKTSYAKEECEVEFDEKIVSPDEIIEVVNKTGYKVLLERP